MENIDIIEPHMKLAGTILHPPASQVCFCLLAKTDTVLYLSKPDADLCLALGRE